MRALKNTLFFSVLFALFCTVIISHTLAAENSFLDQGITYYRQEDYDEALTALKRAREEDPKSTLAAYYLGLTYKQIQDYKEAKPHLEDAITETPRIKGALMELIEVLYQLGELKEAHNYIEIAERENIRPAQTSFMKGLVLAKEGRNVEAVEAFERAKGLDASLTQTANYQIGLLHIKEKEFGKAKEAFKEVVILDPNSNVALFANQYMKAIGRREEAERPFKFTAGFSFAYDDNVILKPSGEVATGLIADEDDTREVYTFSTEYNTRLAERMKLKAKYSLYWADQNSLSSFNVLSNSFTVAPSYYFDKASLTANLGYNYTAVDEESYLSKFTVNPMGNLMIGESNMAQAFFRYENKDFLQSAVNSNEDRDANNYAGGVGWFLFFADNKGFFNARYELSYDDTEGSNWEYLGNKFSATLLVPIFDKFKATGFGEAYFQNFENTHTTFGVEREDDIYTAGCILAFNITENAEIQARYTYVKDNSNIAVYDYDRNIFSGGIEYKF